MLTESISVKAAVALYVLATTTLGKVSDTRYDELLNALVADHHLEYIERKEYFGEVPALASLTTLKLGEGCSALGVVQKLFASIPEERWNTLSWGERIYMQYELPYYQRINGCLLKHHTRLANIAFGNENDFIIAVPTEDSPAWVPWQAALDKGQIVLQFYPPLDDDGVVRALRTKLPSLFAP